LPSVVSVIDDDADVLESLRVMLKVRGYQVEVFRSAEDFLENRRTLPSDCLIVDLHLPGMSGLDLQKRVAECCNTPIIMLTGHGDLPTAVCAMKAGAIDFLEKPCVSARLLSAVQEAIAFRTGVVEQPGPDDILQTLTREERGVLRGMLRGMSNREIADVMDLSLRTVQFRRNSLFRKLDVVSKQQVMERAFLRGWTPNRIED
jgi:two-component system response regulator FixJ